MVVAYFCGWLPADLLGRADVLLYKRASLGKGDHPWWQQAVSSVVLGYADQQIATGIAILMAAFIKMQDISVYHLHVVIYLAWMSSNTHISAVSLLQAEFRNSKRPKWRALRIFGMSAIGIMTIAMLVPTTSIYWDELANTLSPYSAGSPAICFWRIRYQSGFSGDSIWSFTVMTVSLLWKGLLLFNTSHKFVKFTVRRVVLGTISKWLDFVLARRGRSRRAPNLLTQAKKMGMTLIFKVLLALYVALWLLLELSGSFVISLWMCAIGLAWGSTRILLHRSYISEVVLKKENEWGFGQILPIMLLVVPVLGCMETLSGIYHHTSDKPRANARY